LPLNKTKPLSLDKHKRLRRRADFLRFFKDQTSYRLKTCLVFRIKNQVGHFRLGITLKIKASSPERNKVKRTIREFFRKNVGILGSFDYNVVIVKQKTIGFPYFEDLRKDLDNNFEKCLNK
jgi:ribonuclease P protein component